MIRTILVLLLIAAMVLGGVAMLGDPGSLHIVWRPWDVTTTGASGVFLLLLFGLVFAIVWRLVMWFAQMPRRSVAGRAARQRREGMQALSAGYLALAAGDAAEARRQAASPAALALRGELPDLIDLLTAQSAAQAGDPQAARAAYAPMLENPQTRPAAQNGLAALPPPPTPTPAAPALAAPPAEPIAAEPPPPLGKLPPPS